MDCFFPREHGQVFPWLSSQLIVQNFDAAYVPVGGAPRSVFLSVHPYANPDEQADRAE